MIRLEVTGQVIARDILGTVEDDDLEFVVWVEDPSAGEFESNIKAIGLIIPESMVDARDPHVQMGAYICADAYAPSLVVLGGPEETRPSFVARFAGWMDL